MSEQIWRINLETTARQFESVSRFTSLLLHAGGAFFPRIESPIFNPLFGQPVRKSFSEYGADAGRWNYFAGMPRRSAFLDIARSAGEALSGVPEPPSKSLQRQVADDRSPPPDPAVSWIWFLHDTAWQESGRVSWRVEREIPLRSYPAHYEPQDKKPGAADETYDWVPYSTEELRELLKDEPERQEFPPEWAETLPDYYESRIEDVPLASVHACKWLLSLHSNEVTGAGESDGPCHPYTFRWEGKACDDFPRTAWRLVNYLWSKQSKSADFRELEFVWGRVVSNDQVKSAAKKACEYFRGKKLPFLVHVDTCVQIAYLKKK